MKEELFHISYQPSIHEEKWSQKTVASIMALIDHARFLDGKHSSKFSILDVGCGRGELLRAAKKKRYVVRGVDIDPRCLEISRRFAECIDADLMHLSESVGDESVDLVVLSHILEHLPNPVAAIDQAKATSSKWIIVSVPNLCSLAVVLNNFIGRRHTP